MFRDKTILTERYVAVLCAQRSVLVKVLVKVLDLQICAFCACGAELIRTCAVAGGGS